MAKLLKSVKIYILLGYITLIMIASVTVWVIYNETLELYDNQVDMNPVSNKIFLANAILTDLYEAENLERSYLQTGNAKHYNDYNVLIDSISSHIDLLGSIGRIPSQVVHTDSIQKLLTKKRENLKELNLIKNSASSEKLYERALRRITQNKDSLDQLFQVYTSMNTNRDSIYTKQKKARFFERLIDVFAPPSKPDSSLQVVVNNSVKVDSIYTLFNPADSVEQMMASIIEEIHNENVEFEKQLIKKEQENFENAQIITLQIRQILSQLESEEILYSLNKVSTQQEHISQMTNIVIILGGAALLVIIGFLTLILKDITKSQHYRQNLEKEKAYSESLLKSKEQLMLSITHDLKSPLNSITGFAHLAAKEKTPERQMHYLKNIEYSANHVLRLIKDLLDFARLETGKLPIEQKSLDLKLLIGEVVAGFYPLAKEKNLNLELDIASLPQQNYITDGARINQVLSNLISNAIKFTSEGFVKVSVSVKKSKGKTDWIKIEVTDTGIGIAEENAHLIFEEFARISSSDEKQYEGTGLGLAITKRIVELMNGSIGFTSNYGKGSRFLVELPLQKQSKPQKGKVKNTNTKHAEQLKAFNQERVLLVDDDAFILELTTHLLREANLNVTSFSDANEALKIMDSESFDLLITDMQMPGASGFQLLSRFQAANLDSVRCIAVTGEANNKQHYLDAGFGAVIPKPFQPHNLIDTVSFVLKKPVNAPTTKKMKTNGSFIGSYSIEGIKAFAEGEMETTREILTSFAQSTAQNLQLFKSHLQKQDYEEIKNLAHKMLPMFRQLEAAEIVEPLRKLEQDHYKATSDEWLEESYLVMVNIEDLMERIIEEYQLPFSGKLIS